MPPLLEILADELERPREVSAQVVNHITGTYGTARDDIGNFLIVELLKLEDYEIDLILSPLFTPSLSEQAVFADLLGREVVPESDWPALVQQLVARPTHAQFITDDGKTYRVPLRDVTVERFVHRLRLEGTIAESVFTQIERFAPEALCSMLKAIARRAIWENPARQEIFSRYLANSIGKDAHAASDAVELLKLVEIYQPANLADLLAHIPHWQKVLRQEINDGNAKPFFNERVEELHGGGRDQRRQDNSRLSAKEHEQAFLERLQRTLMIAE